MAGSSVKSLVQKLGIKPGARVLLYHPPRGYRAVLGPLPEGARIISAGNNVDLVQYFGSHRQALASALPGLRERIAPDGAVWVCWPKGTSNVATDVNENVVRHLAIQQGLVDVKVIAVDATWSGLKLVIPVSLRPTFPAGLLKSSLRRRRYQENGT